MTTRHTPRIGLIGCGYWGPNLIRNMYGLGLKVPLVADAAEGRRRWVEETYPATSSVATWQEVVDCHDVDAVAIATPPQTHYEIAKAALENGKHVLIEKPMTLCSKEAEELVSMAADANLLLMVDHVYVYTSPVRKMRELIDSGELGSIYYYDSVRVNLGLFQSHVNVLWDLGPHDLSILDYLVGGLEVESVSAHGGSLPDMEHEYQVYLNMKTNGGITANVHLNWLSPVKIRKIVVAGKNLMTVFDETDSAEQLKVYDKGFEMISDEDKYAALGTYRLGNMQAPHLDGVEALQRMLSQFVDGIQNGTIPDASAQQGLRVVRVLEQAQAILDEGR